FSKLAGRRGLKTDDYYMFLREAGLQEKAFEQKVSGFTPGMRQKVGIAIALIKDAAAILLDEPTSGLDPATGAELLTTLKELQKRGKAILMTTEDPFCAKQIATRVGILMEGRKVMERTSQEFAQEDIEALYFTYLFGLRRSEVGH